MYKKNLYKSGPVRSAQSKNMMMTDHAFDFLLALCLRNSNVPVSQKRLFVNYHRVEYFRDLKDRSHNSFTHLLDLINSLSTWITWSKFVSI